MRLTRQVIPILRARSRLLLAGCGLVLFAAAAACSGGSSGSLTTPTATGSSVLAPEFPTGQTWFNVSKPLTMQQLRGKVVLVDFWTLGCINCQHTVPEIERLEQKYGDALVVIGVHSGKYDREHVDDSVREAVLRLGIDHPVVNDPDFAIWNAYGAQAWPTDVLVDPTGALKGYHEGEGVFDALDQPIGDLIQQFDATKQIDRTPIPIDLEAAPIASAFLNFPGDVLADPAGGRLFIADSDNNRILVSDLDGKLESAIGSGAQGSQDGPAAQAQFDQPQGLALSADGETLYVADTRNHKIRAVDLAGGTVTTIAGDGQRAQAYPTPGSPAATTSLASPWGIQLIGDTLYIAMAGSHQLWTLDLAAQTVSVLAGTGEEGILDAQADSATLAQPNQITTDGTFLYWVDPESSSVRRLQFSPVGRVLTLVGRGLFDFGDVDGPHDSAKIQHAQGIVYAGGTLYIDDTYNHKVKSVDPATGEVHTIAGSGSPGNADGNGGAAQFDEPGGLSAADGKLYIADTNNNAIRVLDIQSGNVSTLQISNLSVAMASVPGRTLKESLTPVTISPSATTLRIRIHAPAGYQLNSMAPSSLTLSTSNDQAFAPGKTDVSWSTDDQSVEVTVPATVASGQAILSAAGDVYYCKEGDNAVCLIDKVDLALPITVSDGASDTEAVMDYELPQ